MADFRPECPVISVNVASFTLPCMWLMNDERNLWKVEPTVHLVASTGGSGVARSHEGTSDLGRFCRIRLPHWSIRILGRIGRFFDGRG
jgi:hypothetical protein